MISATVASRNPKHSPAIRKIKRLSDAISSFAVSSESAAEGKSVFFRTGWRLLAIATLDGFGERGDFFDRRCEILCTARLLLRSGRGLCRGAGGFLIDRRDLSGTMSDILHG